MRTDHLNVFTTTGLALGGFVAPQRKLHPADDATLRLLTGRSAQVDTTLSDPVPCAARPSTRFVHLDGPCRCFVGGPAPEFPPALGSTWPVGA